MQFFILGGHLWDQPQAQQIIVYFLLFISCEPSFRSTTIKPITTITTNSSRWKEWPHQPTTSSIWRIGPHPKFERTTSSSRCKADEGLVGRAGRKRAGEGARTREHSAMLCSPPSLLLKEPPYTPPHSRFPQPPPLNAFATLATCPDPAHALHFDEVVVRSNVGCGPALDMNKVVNRCSTSLLHLG